MDPMLSAALLTLSLLSPAATQPAVIRSQAIVPPAQGGHSLQAAITRDSRQRSQLLTQTESRRQPDGTATPRKNWIRRHPSCVGAAVGFAAGFLIGYLPGDDAVFDDFVAEFNGAVLGGIGAGAGAIVGWLGSR